MPCQSLNVLKYLTWMDISPMSYMLLWITKTTRELVALSEPLRTHTSATDHLWFVVYHWRLRLEWRVLFVWDPTCFLKKLRLRLYFTLGTVYSELSCAITWYHKRFRRPYAHVVALQIICDLLCITDSSAMIDVCFPMWITHTHLVEPCAEQLPG